METFLAALSAADATGTGSDGYGDAWSIPSAWRASTLLGGLIGCLPAEAFRKVRGAPAKCIDPAPAIVESPVPGRTNIEVYSSWVHDYLFHGNAIGIVSSWDTTTGWPTAFTPVPATWVSVLTADTNSMFDLDVLAGEVVYRVGSQVYGPRQVMHVRGPCRPGALRGVGVLEAMLSTFNLAKDQLSQASGIATHGVPTGTLTADDPDVTPEELDEGKRRWLLGQRTRTIATLPPGVKFQPIAWNPEELQLVEARSMTDAQMALAFGLPGSFLNVSSGSLNYSNVGQDGLNLLKFTVDEILVRFEQEISRHLPRGTFHRFDRDAILATDTLSRFQTWAAGISAGFLLPSEAREREGLPPVAGIDDKPAPPPMYGAKYGEPKPADEAPPAPAAEAQEGDDQ
jgi:HK97 family phage portal protein